MCGKTRDGRRTRDWQHELLFQRAVVNRYRKVTSAVVVMTGRVVYLVVAMKTVLTAMPGLKIVMVRVVKQVMINLTKHRVGKKVTAVVVMTIISAMVVMTVLVEKPTLKMTVDTDVARRVRTRNVKVKIGNGKKFGLQTSG